jgi:hypothetical protein
MAVRGCEQPARSGDHEPGTGAGRDPLVLTGCAAAGCEKSGSVRGDGGLPPAVK